MAVVPATSCRISRFDVDCRLVVARRKGSRIKMECETPNGGGSGAQRRGDPEVVTVRRGSRAQRRVVPQGIKHKDPGPKRAKNHSARGRLGLSVGTAERQMLSEAGRNGADTKIY